MKREDIFKAIEKERDYQDEFHPHKLKNNFLPVLVEEVGEVACELQILKDCIDFSMSQKDQVKQHLIDEIIQVASVCVRYLEELEEE